MVYAAKTEVPVDKTKLEIERTLVRYGATRFAYSSEPTRAVIIFEAKDRRMRFILPLPDGGRHGDDQLSRSRWRALLLCLKAKLEAVDSKIESFEEAFLAHVVMPDGHTVGEHTAPQIKLSLRDREDAALASPLSQEQPMTFVLIIFVVLSGKPAALALNGYTSKEACVVSARSFIEAANATGLTAAAYCIQGPRIKGHRV